MPRPLYPRERLFRPTHVSRIDYLKFHSCTLKREAVCSTETLVSPLPDDVVSSQSSGLNITRASGKYLFRSLCNYSVNCVVRIMWEKDVVPFLKVGVVFDWITITLQTFVWGEPLL